MASGGRRVTRPRGILAASLVAWCPDIALRLPPGPPTATYPASLAIAAVFDGVVIDGSWPCSSCRLCDVLGAGHADEATVERRDQDAGLGMFVQPLGHPGCGDMGPIGAGTLVHDLRDRPVVVGTKSLRPHQTEHDAFLVDDQADLPLAECGPDPADGVGMWSC